MELNITWGVDDGYAGSRPQQISFETDDYTDDWNELSETEKNDIIDDVVDQDFNNKISCYVISVDEN